MNSLSVERLVEALKMDGYIEKGGSDVFRLIVDPKNGQHIKIYYSDYDNQESIIIREI